MLRSSVFSKVFIVLKFRANFAPPLRLVLDGRRQAIAKASGIWASYSALAIRSIRVQEEFTARNFVKG